MKLKLHKMADKYKILCLDSFLISVSLSMVLVIISVLVPVSEVKATPVSERSSHAGPNQPTGYLPVFVLGGSTTDPNSENPGFVAPGQATVGAAKWDVNGGPVSPTGNRIESVNTDGTADGKAFRLWMFEGDVSGFHGNIITQNISNWVPPEWPNALGTPRSYYWRARYRLSSNFQQHPGRIKIFGYLGSADTGHISKSDYIVSLHTGAVDSNVIQLAAQNTGDDGALFRTTTATPPKTKGEWWDIETIITTQSAPGANDGSVKMWVNGDLFMEHSGLSYHPGMNGFQAPMFYGGSGFTVTEPSMYIDYDMYYVSASPDDAAVLPSGDTLQPSIPSNLTLSVVSSSQINLSWTGSTDNVAVTGYRIYRCLGASCTPVQVATSTCTSYNNTGLSPNTTYTYTVAAYDAAGNVSYQSASKSATTAAPTSDTSAPSIPSGLSTTAVSSSQINLSWSASTDNVAVTGYRVYRNGAQLAVYPI